jgi:hypothetical protein
VKLDRLKVLVLEGWLVVGMEGGRVERWAREWVNVLGVRLELVKVLVRVSLMVYEME